MFFVYILKNKYDKLYIGYTNDVQRRLVEHNYLGSGYTSKHRPWSLIYKEEYQTRSESLKREKFLKTGKGRGFIKNTIMRD